MSPRYSFHRLVIVCLCASVFLAQALVGQGSSIIKGKVVDAATGDGLPGANIVLVSSSVGAASDVDGNYMLRTVPAGQWTIRVTFVGYGTVSEDVTVEENTTVSKDFRLSPQVLEGKEIVVTAQGLGQVQAINQQLASNKIASIVSEARIQELPDFNAAAAIARLPGVSSLQSSGEANKIVIRGLAPQYNAVAISGITLASTGSSQIGAASQGGTSGAIYQDRSVDLTMVTPYMIKSVEVFKSLTPDLDANAIGGYVNMNLREAPEGFRGDALLQGGYTQKSSNYGNYRFVLSASNRFLDDALGIYVLGNAERYDRDADNMNAAYSPQSAVVQPDGFRPVIVQNVTLNRHIETRNRYGGNLIVDYKLPAGSIRSVNVFSRLNADTRDYRTILDYQFHNLNFRYREGDNNTDMAVNSLEYTNDFGLFSAELKVANTYTRNNTPRSPQFDFIQTGGITGSTPVNTIPDSLKKLVTYNGTSRTYLTNISLFSADYKENDQVYKADFKVPFNLEGISSGFFKVGGEFRYNYRTNNQGTPYAGIRPGSNISNAIVNLINSRYDLVFDSSAGYYPALNFTSDDRTLNGSFLDDRFGGILWITNPAILNGITDALSTTDSVNAIHSSGVNAGGWTDGPYQRLPNKYKYIEKYSAGYVMAEANFGEDIMVVGGFRWEQVKSLFDAFNLSDGRDARSQVVDSVSAFPSNRFWLPMGQVRWKPFEWADVRYSFTRTLARPDYHQLSPHFNMDYTQFNVWAGNPRLKPARSHNNDLFLTFHTNELGLLSIGGFYKTIRNFAYYTQYKLHLTAPPGLDSVGSYSVRTNSGIVNPKDGATLNTYTNNHYPAYVKGFEIDFQTRLWYLPEPLNGMIFGINYTHVKSQATYPWRNDTTIIVPPRTAKVVTIDRTREGRLINQPNDVVNAYIGYDRGGFSGRISFLYQGNSVSNIGPFAEQDGFTKDYFRIDASARQVLPWFGLQLFIDLNNLNNRKNDAVQASINGFTSQQYYGLTANVGLRYIM